MAANVPLPSRPMPRANPGMFAPAAAPPVRIPDGVTVLRGEALAAEQEKRRGAKRAAVKNFRAPAESPAPTAGVVSDAKPAPAVKAAPAVRWTVRLVLWGGSIVEPESTQCVDSFADCGFPVRARGNRPELEIRWDLDAASYTPADYARAKDPVAAAKAAAVAAAKAAVWASSEVQAAVVVASHMPESMCEAHAALAGKPCPRCARITRAGLVAELGDRLLVTRDADRERDRIAADHAPRTACQRQRRGGEFPRKAKDFRATFSRGFDGPAAPRTYWPSR